MDVNVYHSNLFHTRMMVRDIDLDNYVFNFELDQLTDGERQEIQHALEREMLEIYNGSNIFE